MMTYHKSKLKNLYDFFKENYHYVGDYIRRKDFTTPLKLSDVAWELSELIKEYEEVYNIYWRETT